MLLSRTKKAIEGILRSRWFFPTLSVVALVFLVPLSFDHYSGLHINSASASLYNDMVDGFSKAFWKLIAVISKYIYDFALSIFYFSSYLFRFAADYSTRGSTYSNLSYINSVWGFIRDLINSLFIFAVLYVAFKQLLSFDGNFDTAGIKKTLLHIVIAALLINFSLFFTKAAVDVSNFLSRALLCKMQTSDTSIPDKPARIECDPAEVISKGLSMQTFLSETKKVSTQEEKDKFMTIAYLGGAIAYILTSIAFFTIAFVFIIRIIILILLMATSPVYFISQILNFKGVSDLSDEWLKALKGQLIFPVVFMLILFITAKFASSPGFKIAGGSFSSALNGEGADADFLLILNYGLIIFMLFYGLKAAKDMSGIAGTYGSKLSGFAMGAVLGGSGMIGRNVLGRAGGALSRSKLMQNLASKTSNNRFANGLLGSARFVGDRAIRMGKKAEAGSWDARGSKAFNATLGRATSEYGLNTGKAQAKSFKKDGKEFGAYVPRSLRMGLELSKDGKKKEAADILARMKEVHDGNPEQLANRLKAELGDDFLKGGEFKEERVKLAAEIKKTKKDDAAGAEKLLTETFGSNFSTGKEFEGIRGEISKEKKVKQVKDSAKAFGAGEKDLQKYKEDLAKAQASGASPSHLQNLQKLIDDKRKDVDKTRDDFSKGLKGTNANIVADLAAGDISKLRGQLNKAHMQAIAKKLQEDGGYNDADRAILNQMAKEMMLDEHNTDPAMREWFTGEMEKGTEGFEVDLRPELDQEMSGYDAAIAAGDSIKALAHEEKIRRHLRAIRTEELKDMDIDKLMDEGILSSVRPKAILLHHKIAVAKGDTATLAKMAAKAERLKDPLYQKDMPQGARVALRSALMGLGGKNDK